MKGERLAGLDVNAFIRGEGIAGGLKRHALIRAIGPANPDDPAFQSF